jgi:hypothetical protein
MYGASEIIRKTWIHGTSFGFFGQVMAEIENAPASGALVSIDPDQRRLGQCALLLFA